MGEPPVFPAVVATANLNKLFAPINADGAATRRMDTTPDLLMDGMSYSIDPELQLSKINVIVPSS